MEYNEKNPFRAYVPLPNEVLKTIDDEMSQSALELYLRGVNYHEKGFCELGRPNRGEYQGHTEWVQRLMYIDENRVCAKVLKAHYDEKTGHIVADIIPFGPYRESFNVLCKPENKLAFSVRAMTNAGKLANISTFDVVMADTMPEKRDFVKEWMRG